MQFLLILFICQLLCFNSVEDWNLPVFPAIPPPINGNRIPKHLWTSVRDLVDLKNQMAPVFTKNPGWELHIYSNEMRNEFMETTFAGTSYLWAYKLIHSCAEIAKEDLWKYAVLWAFGGAYIDHRSDMDTPLDRMIEVTL